MSPQRIRYHNKGLPTRSHVLLLSLFLNALLALMLVVLMFVRQGAPPSSSSLRNDEVRWNGGHPLASQTGSCFCNWDHYCLCSPSVAVDVIVTSGPDHVWFVRRKDTNQLATPGGFVQVGETVEHAVIREVEEETGVRTTDPILFGVYSDPRRDNRRHTVSIVYIVSMSEDQTPKALDDAKEVTRMPLSQFEEHDLFADHKTILLDYRRARLEKKTGLGSSVGFATDIVRSVC